MAGKKYEAAKAKVDRSRIYNYKEGIALAKEIAPSKFDESVELSFFLNIDPRQADQNIRGAIVLPNGTGKKQTILVITQGAKEEEARQAGADYVGGADMIEKIKGGWFEFDKIVATPDMMGQLGKLGKLLGPKGLMPNPKTGTVTMNVAQAIDEIKKGKAEYRTDRDGNVNVMIGKCSFTDEALAENFKAIYDQIVKIKPAAVKGTYIKNLTLSTTMGPGIHVSVE
ncbi:MAG: 50S ribosomal protein L1 [Erysipelotrichaceae bacterium]|jgi:large subunit ribosomal protein L1|nr:50S ribosomal protein L1 [Erysipelotrichaceae bacterium]